MKRSLALGLYLLTARGGAGVGAVQAERPSGRLVWLRASRDSRATAQQLARQLEEDHPELTVLVSPRSGVEPRLESDAPAETLLGVQAFLDHWHPDVVVLIGDELPAILVTTCHDRAIPMIWVDVRFRGEGWLGGLMRAGMTRGLVQRLRAILVRDADSAEALRRLGGAQLPVTVSGPIEETLDPLPCQEADRAALVELLGTRPVWLAAACPPSEEETVIAAHSHALRLAHRMLLILVPSEAERAPALAARMEREGWKVAQRALGGEPDPDVEVLLTEGQSEMGLWYRLAPVCYMGGTLTEGGTSRNPYEAAALGSAILHGPHPAPYPDAYDRLAGARAARLIGSATGLREAVGDLIAPDRAAILAHNAWVTSSGGAEVCARVIREIVAVIEEPTRGDAG